MLPYRVLARQRLGLGEAPGQRAPVKERLGLLAQPVPVQEAHVYEPVEAETPYKHGLRRERAIRESSQLRQEEVARGATLLGRALRREQ
jgi:hypothetical protein